MSSRPHLMAFPPQLTPQELSNVARAAEAGGIETLWNGDASAFNATWELANIGSFAAYYPQ